MDLFDALIAHSFDDDVVQASFGGRRGWVLIEPTIARDLLRRRELVKGRRTVSRAAVGGYPSRRGAEFHRRRSDVVLALARAAGDMTAMATSLAAAVGASLPERKAAPAVFTRWMLHDLAGRNQQPANIQTLIAGVAAAAAQAEAAQAGTVPEGKVDEARDALVLELADRVRGANTVFVSQLQERGWSTCEIVEELIALALAGWESTAAAVNTAIVLGIGKSPSELEISELLRLYPPSWLIVRELTGAEPWGSAGELAVVSPWLTHRSSAWRNADLFNPHRTDTVASMPFGAGARRCPADTYARAQLAVALGAFGGGELCSARPALLGNRSATLIPDIEVIL